MSRVDLENGIEVFSVKDCQMIGCISPISERFCVQSEGFWVQLGFINESGIMIDNNEWNQFVQMINEMDTHIKENY